MVGFSFVSFVFSFFDLWNFGRTFLEFFYLVVLVYSRMPRYEQEFQTSRSWYRMLACIVDLVLAGLCCRTRDRIRVESCPVANSPKFQLTLSSSVLSESGWNNFRMSFNEMACLCSWNFGSRPFHLWCVSRSMPFCRCCVGCGVVSILGGPKFISSSFIFFLCGAVSLQWSLLSSSSKSSVSCCLTV